MSSSNQILKSNVKPNSKPNSHLEDDKVDWRQFKPGPVVGTDEVGRGCLAGPVVAAVVGFDDSKLTPEFLGQLTDSKLISEKKRPQIANLIHESHFVSIASASVEEIDELNILQASFLAMKRALDQYQEKYGSVGHVLVDGHLMISDYRGQQTPIIKGDLRCSVISAAAIVAKVYRDQWMIQIGQQHPEYLFQKHKGYGSAAHRQVIQKIGITEWHRRSFSGVKEYV